MSSLDESRQRAEMLLAEARSEAERRAVAVRDAVSRDLGIVPKKQPLLLAAAAGAVGFALAYGWRKKRSRAKR